uniref:Uncharacterized protein n=1 Tax=Anopheles atroparvus TaxID=41427 RepID=A0AAG5DSR1_ANOAO
MIITCELCAKQKKNAGTTFEKHLKKRSSLPRSWQSCPARTRCEGILPRAPEYSTNTLFHPRENTSHILDIKNNVYKIHTQSYFTGKGWPNATEMHASLCYCTSIYQTLLDTCFPTWDGWGV